MGSSRKKSGGSAVTIGSGNVFADLGLPRADLLLEKAKLAAAICAVIRQRRLTQGRAATLLGVDQSKVSKLMRGQFDGFSTERLVRFLTRLDQDVTISVRPAARAHGGTLRVRVEA